MHSYSIQSLTPPTASCVNPYQKLITKHAHYQHFSANLLSRLSLISLPLTSHTLDKSLFSRSHRYIHLSNVLVPSRRACSKNLQLTCASRAAAVLYNNRNGSHQSLSPAKPRLFSPHHAQHLPHADAFARSTACKEFNIAARGGARARLVRRIIFHRVSSKLPRPAAG